MHEAEMHESNAFITLTYRDDELIHGYSRPTLYPLHLQLFWKRLRKEYGNGIKYYACGEYGERFNRPHYHACVFGIDFKDKTFCSAKNGLVLYTSDKLNSLWGLGNCVIGDVTFESAAYTARYIMDKKLGHTALYYSQQGYEPEFVRMSRNPGIGARWYDKYEMDVLPHDYCVIRNGIKVKPPKYYSRKKELDNPAEYSDIQLRRKLSSYKSLGEMTRERLIVREKVKKAQINSLHR